MAQKILAVVLKPRHHESTLEIGYWGEEETERTTASTDTGGTLVRDRIRSELEAGVTRFLIDLSRVEWLSSTWIGWMVAWHRAVEEAGGRMAFGGTTPGIHRVLEATRVSSWLPAFDTIPDAINHIQGDDG
jgi:anti-anti-sigma factor